MYFHLFPNLFSNELLFKSINKGMRSNCQGMVLPLSSLKRGPIHKSFKINEGYIFIFYWPIQNGNCPSIVLSFPVYFLNNFLFCHF